MPYIQSWCCFTELHFGVTAAPIEGKYKKEFYEVQHYLTLEILFTLYIVSVMEALE